MPGLGDKIKALGQDPRAAQGAEWYKKAETGIWRALDPLGKGVNKLANRAGAESFWPTELAEGEIEKAARILRSFSDGAQADDDGDLSGGVSDAKGKGKKDKRHQKVVKKIPPKALQGACGIAIMTLFRTGFGVSGASGSGVVVARLPDGSWSPPSGLLVHTIGFGWLIGLDVYDVVLVLRKPAALEEFMKPKVSLGAEFSVAAGPVGNGAMLEGGPNGAACWSYTKSKGAYVGLQLDGSIILKRDDANARFYGGSYSVRDILQGRAMGNAAAVRPLLATLYAAEGRPQVMGMQYVPQGPAPGDTGISEQEKAALQQQAQEQEQQGASNPYAAGAPMHPQTQHAPPSHAPPGNPYAAAGAAAGAADVAHAAAPQSAYASNPYAADSAPHTSANLPPGYQGGAATPALHDQKTGSTGRRLPPPAPPLAAAAAGAAAGTSAGSSVPQDAPPGYDAPAYDAPPAHASAAAAAAAPLVPNASDEKEQLRRKYAAEDAAASAGSAGHADPFESAAPPAAAGAQTNLPAQVTALFDFEGAEPGDLSFAAGDVIDVKHAESDGWWTGSVRGKPGSGIFPVNYTKPL